MNDETQENRRWTATRLLVSSLPTILAVIAWLFAGLSDRSLSILTGIISYRLLLKVGILLAGVTCSCGLTYWIRFSWEKPKLSDRLLKAHIKELSVEEIGFLRDFIKLDKKAIEVKEQNWVQLSLWQQKLISQIEHRGALGVTYKITERVWRILKANPGLLREKSISEQTR